MDTLTAPHLVLSKVEGQSRCCKCSNALPSPRVGTVITRPNSPRRFRLFREYLRRFGAGEHAIIALHLGDADAVVGEDLIAAMRLRNMMLGLPAPRDHSRLIAPERQRYVFPLGGQAAEALDRNETIYGLENRTQAGGDLQIGLQAARLGLHFEDDGEHGGSFWPMIMSRRCAGRRGNRRPRDRAHSDFPQDGRDASPARS